MTGKRRYDPTPIIRTLNNPHQEWKRNARCGNDAVADALFFAPDDERPDARARRERHAKTFCHSCDVRPDCLRSAIDNDEPLGIWGGLTRAERERLAHRDQNEDAA